MQFSQIAFCFVALMAIRVHSLPIFDALDDDANQVDNSLHVNGGMNLGLRNPWVKTLIDSPKVIKRESGSVVEIVCEASGSPAPVVTWFRDQIPITEEEFESNVISDLSYTAMATVESKLIIKNFQPAGKNIYTCVARSGSATSRSSVIVHTTHHKSHMNLNPAEYSLINQEVLQKPSSPKIVTHIRTILEEMGNTVVLPCRVAASPNAEINWFYNDSEPIIEGQKHKISPSGDLVFYKLSWADMGQYTCVARNSLGEDNSTTFLYPLAIEK